MSYTSLWTINEEWKGAERSKYHNSYLFPPVVWDILLCKYVTDDERNNTLSYLMWIGFTFDKEEQSRRFDMLNSRINNSEIQYDRVLWELANLSVFNAKDKALVADCIEKFVENNFNYLDFKDVEHIKERFCEVEKDIRELPEECKFFVIHPTSCDDNVEWWFERGKALSSWDKYVCEFTLIENEKVVGFSDNLKMCKEDNK